MFTIRFPHLSSMSLGEPLLSGRGLMLKPNPDLDKALDVWIAKIAAAQEPDGYLYTARTINPTNPPRMSGKERWVNLQNSHELYVLGHMYEAAVAHFQATGKRNLLDVIECYFRCFDLPIEPLKGT